MSIPLGAGGWLLGVAVVVSACGRTARDAGVVVSEVTFRSGNDDVPAILARPGGPGEYPAALLIHANSLREPYIAESAERLAKAGFVALAVDVAAVVAFYSPVMAADDPSVPAADVARFADTLRARGTLMEGFVYQARHGFVASSRTGIFDSAAADLAWSRVLPFLATHAGKPILRRPLAPPFAVR